MLSVSRMMPIELQRIIAAMIMESTGSIRVMPVKRMAAPPTMTAAVESVSPSMWRKTLRMLTSPEKRQSRVATVPFIRTPSCGDVHHQPGLNSYRDGEAVDSFERDPDREDDEGNSVDEGREDTRTLVAEGFCSVAGAPGNRRRRRKEELRRDR